MNTSNNYATQETVEQPTSAPSQQDAEQQQFRPQQHPSSATANNSSHQQQQQPQVIHQLSSKQIQQPEHQQQDSHTAAQAAPVKRVGFSMDGVVVGAGAAADSLGGKQQNVAGVSRRKQEQLQREEQSQAKQRNKYDEKLVDALGDVPELEEAGKEDITRKVAQAPKASNPRVQAISQLDLDQAWVPAQTSRSTDINLSLLTSCLLPSAQVAEPADVWDYDTLLSQLKAELQHDAGPTPDQPSGYSAERHHSSIDGAIVPGHQIPDDSVPA